MNTLEDKVFEAAHKYYACLIEFGESDTTDEARLALASALWTALQAGVAQETLDIIRQEARLDTAMRFVRPPESRD